jgi:hypothetical protein
MILPIYFSGSDSTDRDQLRYDLPGSGVLSMYRNVGLVGYEDATTDAQTTADGDALPRYVP